MSANTPTALFLASAILSPVVSAAPDNTAGPGYLEYQEPVLTAGASGYSTFLYILSLLVVFIFVLFLAYFVSKFLGGKWKRHLDAAGHITGVMPLEHNKKIVFLEVNASLFVLGVTEQNITLLKEITDKEEVRRVKEDFAGNNTDKGLFAYQRRALSGLRDKVRPMLPKSNGKEGNVR